MKATETVNNSRSAPSISNHKQSTNVLYIIGSLRVGGAESQVVTLASALNSDRYKVYVCCLGHEGIQANFLRARGIQVVSLNMRLRYLPITACRLYFLIKHLNPEIVHTHLYHAGILGRLISKLAGVPVIIATEHGMYPWKKRFHWFLERPINRFTDKVTAVSEEIRQHHINNQAIIPKKIIIVPNAVDIERFSRTFSRERVRAELGIEALFPVVGTVARLVHPKRLDYFLAAARMVCDIIPQARFLIIGDGPLREVLENQAFQLELIPEYVMFLGSRQDIPDLLSALDIFVLSSETEGLPVSMLEAMAASRPVVATRVGGIPQVIEDGHNGLLVSPHDPTSLAKAILTLMGNNALRESVATNGYQMVRARFSTTMVVQQIVALYDSLLDEKG
jgi:glycosyltransferase involved in cell wall biosynthesis